MKKLRLGVVIGGKSSEHEISLLSGYGVLSNLDPAKYIVHVIIISESGDWFLYYGDLENIKDGRWREDSENLKNVAMTSLGKLLLIEEKHEFIELDVVFSVLHGSNGEDGRMQGFFETAGIPFVGSRTASSAVCMDKDFTNSILAQNGIDIAEWITLKKREKKTFGEMKEKIEKQLKYPVFVKPANSGSSVGISKVKGAEVLEAAIDLAFREDGKILVQRAIEGQEIECAVLGNDEPIASFPGEIEPCNEFYDYEAKYFEPSVLHIPARIGEEAAETIKSISKKAYSILGCCGMARVDYILDQNGNAWLIEINTIPGFTEISMYPKMLEKMGIGYSELLDTLINLALEKR
ncbi:MAG: D-alanine--D-alanine ligase [Oscillospiraceae bacterium]|jgi:D-alanine-D-alanine ligase|nr:D-alanine--D-alanine ligase [Oscillospiraceae bacterium]